MQAAQHGAVDVLHWLLEKGANPNIKDGKFKRKFRLMIDWEVFL